MLESVGIIKDVGMCTDKVVEHCCLRLATESPFPVFAQVKFVFRIICMLVEHFDACKLDFLVCGLRNLKRAQEVLIFKVPTLSGPAQWVNSIPGS
jgi:hypothetical protein